MIKVRFKNREEIRMGSPFNTCDIILEDNKNRINLPNKDWQDKFSTSPDGKLLALIFWDIKCNEPDFRILLVDIKKQNKSISKRFNGICKSISWAENGFNLDIITYVKIINNKLCV